MIKTRLKSESPDLFKFLFKLSASSAALGAALVALGSVPGIILATWVIPTGSHILVGSTFAAFISKLTVKDPTILDNQN
jgi:hypothetical protein